MSASLKSPSTAWLTAVGVALTGGIAVALFGHGDQAIGENLSAVPKMTIIGALTDEPIASVGAVLSEPVFHHNRTFIPPTPLPASVPTPPTLELMGYMSLSGKSPVVIVRNSATGKSQRLQVGESIDGWTVIQAEARTVHLGNSGFTVVVGRPGSGAATLSGSPAVASVAGVTPSRPLDPARPPPLKPMNRSLRPARAVQPPQQE